MQQQKTEDTINFRKALSSISRNATLRTTGSHKNKLEQVFCYHATTQPQGIHIQRSPRTGSKLEKPFSQIKICGSQKTKTILLSWYTCLASGANLFLLTLDPSCCTQCRHLSPPLLYHCEIFSIQLSVRCSPEPAILPSISPSRPLGRLSVHIRNHRRTF